MDQNKSKNHSPEKSCGPQPFSHEEPSHRWDVEQLGQYAQHQHQLIVDGEKQIAPAYWRLGQALSLARKQFGHGHWGKYLDEWSIDKTRASKARAIFRTFSTEKHVEGKSVEEAYSKRLGRQDARNRATAQKSGKRRGSLPAFVKHLPRQASALIDDAKAVSPEEARHLLVTVAEVIDQLKKLEKELRRRAGNVWQ